VTSTFVPAVKSNDEGPALGTGCAQRSPTMNGCASAIRLLGACILMWLTAPSAFAQTTYPSQPIRFLVTTAPGAGLDSFSRLLAKELTQRAGQQVIVDNRPGAGTTIGTAVAAKAKPDGYSVLVSTSSFAISPAIYQKLPYDSVRDFAPITLAASAPNLMVVHPSVPVTTVRDVIALAKARASRGDPLLYASGGTGTNGHMAMALFLSMAHVRMTHVPYKSGSLAVIDLVGGQVPVMIDTVSSLMPQVAAGKLRAIAVSSPRRAAAIPNVPTITESGVPGCESAQWYGVWTPAGTPQDIIAWLSRETTASLRTASVSERLATDGLDVVASSPDELATHVKSDIAKWTRVVKTLGITLM
jgi:tripartite-type tricarboxylate transporter receptor subunit TctC